MESSKNLLEITEAELVLSRRLEKAYVYASMKNDQDTTRAGYQEFQAKATALLMPSTQKYFHSTNLSL